MKFKRLITIVIVAVMTLIPFSNLSSIADAKTKTNTGEDYFKAFYFGQGKVGEKLKDNFTSDYYKKLNNKESKKYTSTLTKQMKDVDKNYFPKLQKAVDEENPIEVEKILKDGKSIVNKTDLAKEQEKKISKNQMSSRGNEYGFHRNKTLYKTYAAVQDVAGALEVGAAVAVVVVAAAVLAADTKDGVTQEEQVSDLIKNSN